jgi:hypothetical protein
MKIECSRPLAGTLAGAVLHTNDDRFKDQAALL